MNRELEALVLALEAVIQARVGAEAEKLDMEYQVKLDGVLQRCPNLSRDTLQRLVDLAHKRWLRAQDKPSSLPPKA